MGFNANNTHLKYVLMTKYEHSDKMEVESLNDDLDDIYLES